MKTNIILLLCIIFFLFGNIGMTFLQIPADYLYCILVIYGLIVVFFYKHEQEKTEIEKLSLWIVGSGLIWFFFRYLIVGWGGGLVISVLILPAFLIFILTHKTGLDKVKLKQTISQFFYYFFIIECCIAIVEFLMQQRIFGWGEIANTKDIVKSAVRGFRSTALLEGPLNNALVVSVFMLFILFNSRISLKKKMSLWLLGLSAVFCFNARTAIAVNLLSLFTFIGKSIFTKNSTKRISYIFFIIITCIVLFLFYNYGWGSRLWDTESFNRDKSIGVRLRLFEYILKADWLDYLWGFTYSEVDYIMKVKIGVKIIENFWVLYAFWFGIPLTIYFLVLYTRLCKIFLSPYPCFDKIVISSSFLIIASSNNSLFSNFHPLFTFMLCAYTYAPFAIYKSQLVKWKNRK